MRDLQLVIFDCDSVLVDSEVIFNEVLARMLTERAFRPHSARPAAPAKGSGTPARPQKASPRGYLMCIPEIAREITSC
jgi:beta-phosphoglucomutase-like phosphatase (HAD superfamily)